MRAHNACAPPASHANLNTLPRVSSNVTCSCISVREPSGVLGAKAFQCTPQNRGVGDIATNDDID